jgi:nucleotide-binding universal stress UspA family protein
MTVTDPSIFVVAFDFSSDGELALKEAVSLADRYGGARVSVVTVGAPHGDDVRLDVAGKVSTMNQRSAQSMVKMRLARVLGEGHDAERIECHVGRGGAGAEIVRFAAEVNADLVVMGTHGRQGMSRALVGSVAEYVVRHAGCPVLVVRPKAHAPSKAEPTDTAEGDAT